MKGKSDRQRGITLIMVMVYLSIAMMYITSLSFLVGNRVILGKLEGVRVQARAIAKVGVAKALADYPETASTPAVPFGNGFYSYRVAEVGRDRIAIKCKAAKTLHASRLPAIELTTRWQVDSQGETPAYRLLLWQERVVPSDGKF